jgi:NitT/TauT family transport system permease protein
VTGESSARRAAGGVLSAASLACAVGFWQLAAARRWHLGVSFENVPTPVRVFAELCVLLRGGELFAHIAASARRIAIAYTLAAALGTALGVAVGRSRLLRRLLLPHLELLRPIPAVAWIPLAILMAPSEESSIVFITFLGAFFPIALNAIHGAEQTPELLLRAAQCLGASRRARFWHVVLPAALPAIATGLAVGMGVAWFSLLAGEIISGQYGVGYFTWAAYSLVQYPQIVIGMGTIGALGLLSTALVRLALRPLLRWQVRS